MPIRPSEALVVEPMVYVYIVFAPNSLLLTCRRSSDALLFGKYKIRFSPIFKRETAHGFQLVYTLGSVVNLSRIQDQDCVPADPNPRVEIDGIDFLEVQYERITSQKTDLRS
ncbi:uncharacterized protein PHALS_10559 [Plasmopara halstedii]|uniref:Uncharacterized protein n=1 Tax=Plasmopara halstedii TaxID=4781 RepID=A0A0N7L533_PLAHL|nr:uncharacterized protein PHALS_10559 [Plasmopara halstedii]CEG40355.1 hypothetical protein PHALS_10559 [Plasmopara halstedii]|eukprot:XP_024576724.1 hypothetical protein PHALS_10559 [Plasmopara halstedii]